MASEMETISQSHDVKSENQRQDRCKLHQRAYKLFCSNCSLGICGACMDIGEHDLHQVSNLAVVYGEKLSIVQSKLTRAQEHHDELRSGTAAAYERNLQLLEKEETLVRKEIEAIAKEAELEVSSVTHNRKKTLMEKLEVSTRKSNDLIDLQSKVKELTANEFVRQFTEIAEKCDGLIGPPEAVELQNVDDIQCRLIPPYRFERIVYSRFSKARNNDEKDFVLKSAHDVEWKLTVRKSTVVKIMLNRTNPLLLGFRHVLTVIFPHPDYTKEIRQTFEMGDQNNAFDVVRTTQVAEFCNQGGDLAMKIGIRPLNSLIEKQLLVCQYEEQKEVNEKLSERLQSTTDQYDYNHLIMYFNTRLAEIQKGSYLYSYRIRDEENRLWFLNAILRPNNMVGAYIQLFEGSGTDCSYFIELKHQNPQKTVLKKMKCRHFDLNTGAAWGWEMIKWEELIRDDGFQPDGYLHFRFGVRPVPTLGAANA